MLTKENFMPKLHLLEQSLQEILNNPNPKLEKYITSLGKDALPLMFWEWEQGVGVYGIFKCYQTTGNKEFLNSVVEWFDKRMESGLPEKNVNTVAPMLTMACLYQETGQDKYLPYIKDWAHWVMYEVPRTKEGGIQHVTYESNNDQQLWDDTLFMSVLFLAKAGMILGNREYIDEAEFQFLLHIKYLTDTKTNLWFHGWTFDGSHNFARALWGRGNCWITVAIPEVLELAEISGGTRKFLLTALQGQVEALLKYQNVNGRWHTLIDDPDSYTEISATAGFCFGILKGVRLGYLDSKCLEAGMRALQAVVDSIGDNGDVADVSAGTSVGVTLQKYRNVRIERTAFGQALAMLAAVEGINHI